MQKIIFLVLLGLVITTNAVLAQEKEPCSLAFDSIDEFDSTRVVGAELVNLGYIIPSKFETVDGPKMVEEAKALFMYTQSDSIDGFFLTLATTEYEFEKAEKGFTVLVKLSNGDVEALYNVPDKGTFDKSTNMRVYQHTCAVPFEIYFKIATHRIEKIRISYKKRNKVLDVSSRQQKELLKAIQCVGRKVGYFPIRA